jgi:hypothetical protein
MMIVIDLYWISGLILLAIALTGAEQFKLSTARKASPRLKIKA